MKTRNFLAEAEALAPQLVAWRRDLHQHPELGFQEIRTAGLIAAHLKELGWRCAPGSAAQASWRCYTAGGPVPR